MTFRTTRWVLGGFAFLAATVLFRRLRKFVLVTVVETVVAVAVVGRRLLRAAVILVLAASIVLVFLARHIAVAGSLARVTVVVVCLWYIAVAVDRSSHFRVTVDARLIEILRRKLVAVAADRLAHTVAVAHIQWM